MARPKKWSSEAERLTAYRQRAGVTVQPDGQSVREDSDSVRIAPATVRIAGVTVQTDEAETQPPGFVAFRDCPDVPHDCRADPWIGAGRGTERTYKGRQFVLVARGTHAQGEHEHGVVSAADWHARLPQRCAHGLAGWSCHGC